LLNLSKKGVLEDFTPNGTYYRIGVCSKDGVHSVEPPIPYPGVFEMNKKLQRYVLAKGKGFVGQECFHLCFFFFI
jgi:hypothetical protein